MGEGRKEIMDIGMEELDEITVLAWSSRKEWNKTEQPHKMVGKAIQAKGEIRG
jgi:hypothetical protein